MAAINYYGLSYIGRRSSNQDAYISIQLNADSFFFAVADGMGGAKGGELASKITIETANSFLKERIKEGMSLTDMKGILEEMFLSCQNAIAGQVVQNPELTGMGTTMICLLTYKERYVWGNIGDSRLYKMFDGNFIQLTKDHSFIEEYREKFGNNIPDQIRQQGNVITRAIDGRGDRPDLYPQQGYFANFNEHEVFLMCSDGLILNKIEDINSKPFADYINGSKSIEEAARQLASRAYYLGSTDNITLIIISIGQVIRNNARLQKYQFPPSSSASKNYNKLQLKPVKKFPKNVFLITVSLVLIITAVILGYYFYQLQEVPTTEQSDSINFLQKNPGGAERKNIIKCGGFLNNYSEPVSQDDQICWIPPPNPEQLRNYTLKIFNHDQKLIAQITKDRSSQYFRLKDFPNIDFQHADEFVVHLIPSGLSGTRVEPKMFSVKLRVR